MANGRLGLRTRPGLIRSYTEITSGDADANAFISAIGLTDATQKNAINQLVLDLKDYNIWSKMKAIYPFVGGTADTHKWNLKDPRDLDAAYRLIFSGGITHNSMGVTTNGSNGFLDTKLNPSTVFSSNYAHQSVYLRNNTNNLIVNGVFETSDNKRFDFGYDTNKIPFHSVANTGSSVGSTDARTDGFVLSYRTGTTSGKFQRNNVDKVTTLPSFTSYQASNYFFGARNAAGTAQLYNVQEIAFASLGDTFNDTEAANLYTAVQSFQTTLGRQV